LPASPRRPHRCVLARAPGDLPADARLHAAWARAADDAYAVGAGGLVARFDGAAWTRLPAETRADLYAVAATPRGEVFVGGAGGVLLHREGPRWRDVSLQGPDGVAALFALDEEHVYALLGHALHRWDGRRWLRFDAPVKQPLTHVWASAPDDVWVTGVSGLILRFDGERWASETLPDPGRLFAVSGLGRGELFAVGDDGAVRRHKGRWTRLPLEQPEPLVGVWARGRDEVYARSPGGYGLRFDGQRWRRLDLPYQGGVTGLAGLGEKGLLAVGDHGFVARFDGQRWTFDGALPEAITGLGGTGADDVWAAGSRGNTLHYDGERWTMHPTPAPEGLLSVWSAARDDVWAVGPRGFAARWDGRRWRPQEMPTDRPLTRLGGTGPGYLLAAGHGGLFRWDGAAWTKLPPAPDDDLRGFTTTAPDDVDVVTGRGRLCHFDGTRWWNWARAGASLNDLRGTARRSFVAGTTGIWLWTGKDLAQEPTFPIGNVTRLWQGAPEDLVAVGRDGLVAGWNGRDWDVEHVGTGAWSAVWGADPDTVLVGGERGTLLALRSAATCPPAHGVVLAPPAREEGAPAVAP
jgi:hypothetical protein